MNLFVYFLENIFVEVNVRRCCLKYEIEVYCLMRSIASVMLLIIFHHGRRADVSERGQRLVTLRRRNRASILFSDPQ